MLFQPLNTQGLDLFGAGGAGKWIAFPLRFDKFVRGVIHYSVDLFIMSDVIKLFWCMGFDYLISK